MRILSLGYENKMTRFKILSVKSKDLDTVEYLDAEEKKSLKESGVYIFGLCIIFLEE